MRRDAVSGDTLCVHNYWTLCQELDRLASATWDLVDQSHHQRIALREDALTSVNLIHLKRGHHPGFWIETFTPVIERANGADFEWWIGSHGEGWLGLRVQAKREYHRNYPDVVYTPTKGGPTQCDSLIQTVRAETHGRALYPFYCFYNGWDRGTGWPTDVDWSIGCSAPANCTTVPDVRIFGCGLAPAVAVRPFLAPYTRRRWHKLLALQFPWSWLFWNPWHGPIGSMTGIQAGLHLLMNQVAGDDSAAQQPELYRELPEYVIAAREGSELTQPAPAKRFLVTDIGQASDRG